jgi:hypothetical protein
MVFIETSVAGVMSSRLCLDEYCTKLELPLILALILHCIVLICTVVVLYCFVMCVCVGVLVICILYSN